MKFLHTADWQIGMKAQSTGEAATRVREERIAAGKRVVEAAHTNGAEFIVVAGDVFEDNGVDRVLVQRVADVLSGFNGQVFVIPGNHDPLTPGSVWEHPAWKSAVNVRVLREAAPVELRGAILFPCPARAKHSDADPTSWIPADLEGGIRIGLAHGTVEGIRQDEPDYPIPRDAATRLGLDYMALGHWHSFATYPGSNGAPVMAYSGTHETTKFGERHSGNALIVEIVSRASPPTITPIHTGGLIWKSVDKETRGRGDLARAREEIATMENPGATLIRVCLNGVLMAEERPEIDHIEHLLASRFLAGHLDVTHLRPSPEDDNWLAALPPGIVREAANHLRATADAPGAQSETAAMALMELYAIAVESAR